MRERMLAGDLYQADDPELVREHLLAMALVEELNGTPATDPDARRRVLTTLLGAYGEGSEIRSPFFCDYGYQLYVGARTFANFGLVALDVGRITIGDDVQIGPNVQLLTATHPMDPRLRQEKWELGAPITIGDNAWLGGGVVVCPGVTVGAGTVVGAGSVVTVDLPHEVLAVGSPARVLRQLG